MNNKSIISKFRLAAMHTRMQGFVTSYRSKLILTKYRSRDRDKWTQQQLQKWETRQAWEHAESKINQQLEELAFRAEHNDLGSKKTNALRQKLARAEQLTNIFCETFNATHATQSRLFPCHISSNANGVTNPITDIQEMGTCVHKFDKEGVPATASATRRPYSKFFWKLLRRRKHRERIKPFKHRQRHLYERYKSYFKNIDDPAHAPPPLLLLHGGAGTGKSTLLTAILDYAEFNHITTIRTAFNGINALHIKGDTTASLLHLDGADYDRLIGLTTNQLPEFCSKLNSCKLIVVDELSNQAPWHLAKLNFACQQAKGNTLPFGGVPVILCGDLMQLEPVRAGLSFPAAIIEMCENVWSKPSKKHLKRMRKKKKEANKHKKKNTSGTIDITPNPYDKQHPFALGSSLIKHARWYELNEQVRTDDPEHAAFVTKLYNCKRPTMAELQSIPLLSKDDYKHPQSPWFKAPILVLTHRERHSLTHHAAIRFAKATGKAVIRWRSDAKGWQQSPPKHLEHEAYADPCFYEYFVEGADGFLTATVSKQLGLVNAQSFKCHSLTLAHDEQQSDLNSRIQSASPGDIITLPQEPLSVNIELDTEHFTMDQLKALHYFRLNDECNTTSMPLQPPSSSNSSQTSYTDTGPLPDDTPPPLDSNNFQIPRKQHFQPKKEVFIIPLTRGKGKRCNNVTVQGSDNIKPSCINIIPHFAFQLAFVMTINKSEGQTMPNAILALSEREGASFNMTFRHLYVACSRVKRRLDNRLLLTGRGHRKWKSIHYLTTLPPPLDSQSVLRGFAAKGGHGWEHDQWDCHSTLAAWESVCA